MLHVTFRLVTSILRYNSVSLLILTKVLKWQINTWIGIEKAIVKSMICWWKRPMGKLFASIVGFKLAQLHDDVIKWKHFLSYWPFVQGIHRSPVIPPHKGQWRGALMFSLICAWTNGWVNNRDAGDRRRHRGHNDVIVMMHNWNCTDSEKNIVTNVGFIH